MALNTLKLQQDIEKILTELSTAEDPKAAREAYASKMATAITAFVKTGTVTTTGSATTQTGTIL